MKKKKKAIVKVEIIHSQCGKRVEECKCKDAKVKIEK